MRCYRLNRFKLLIFITQWVGGALIGESSAALVSLLLPKSMCTFPIPVDVTLQVALLLTGLAIVAFQWLFQYVRILKKDIEFYICEPKMLKSVSNENIEEGWNS